MTHILLIWTVVACSHSHCKHDWRPVGEFYISQQDPSSSRSPVITSQQRCEDAAKTMALKVDQYRCVRSK